MSNFRLLSTKILSPQQRQRLLQTGVSYSERNFITTKALPFSADVSEQTLIFTSQNAVKAVFEQHNFSGKTAIVWAKKQKHMQEKGQNVVKMTYNSADLAEFIAKMTKMALLFFAGKQRRSELETVLSAEGITLAVVEVYETIAQPKAVGAFDGVLFYSPSGVNSFHQNNTLNDSVGFALGSTTAEALAPHTSTIITATQPTVEHLIVAVKKHLTHKL